MQQARKILFAQFLAAVFVCLFFVAAFESNLFFAGEYAVCKSSEFVTLSVMELFTIVSIPLALRLFKFKSVSRALTTGNRRERQFIKWGSIRLTMLCLPMLANTLFYYFFMNMAFGYMTIIQFLCLFFVFPTVDRCINETTPPEEHSAA